MVSGGSSILGWDAIWMDKATQDCINSSLLVAICLVYLEICPNVGDLQVLRCYIIVRQLAGSVNECSRFALGFDVLHCHLGFDWKCGSQTSTNMWCLSFPLSLLPLPFRGILNNLPISTFRSTPILSTDPVHTSGPKILDWIDILIQVMGLASFSFIFSDWRIS